MASAKEYPTDRIRNIAVLGHGHSGKTSLVDALCFTAGGTKRRGDVDEGHALTLTTPEEVDHGISMQVTPAHCEWMNVKLNLLDTPGYLDFTGEALAAVRVADAAVIVVSATSGVEVGTETVWEYCEQRGIPRILFVSQMDRDNVDFEAVWKEVRERLTGKALPVEIPIGEGPDFHGIINLFSERAHLYREDALSGAYEEADVPEELESRFQAWETELQESLATTDEALLEEYLEGGHISREEAIDAMARNMAKGEIVPVFCGSARKGYGMQALLKKMVELFPSPAETGGERALVPDTGEEVALDASDDGPLAALVFKTTSEPHVGELSFFRVVSGSMESGMAVVNPRTGSEEKLNHLSVPQGKDRLEAPRLHAGDIGVVAKLRHTRTNDTLCTPGRPLELERIAFPRPEISVALRGRSRSDEDKLGEVLPRLQQEDPTFHAEFDGELHQTIARGLGEIHLDVQIERMKRKFGVEVETERPKIAYRETIQASAEAHGRHKKQTGGRGQFGDCHIRIAPRPRGSGYEFTDSIKGGAIPNKFIPSVDRGIREAAEKGVLAGFPLVDFEAECYDGSYHTVDSSDVAFQVAGSLAFRKAVEQARPVLLEPVMEVEVETPDEYTGDVMGDITQRRGKVQGMEPNGGRTVIRARIPEAELYRYAASLRSMTQGRGHHTRSLATYEPVPEHEAKKILEGAGGEST